jgi:polyferredoxin
MDRKKRTILSAGVFVFVAAMLAIVQVKVQSISPILLERFLPGIGGWIEIPFIAFYGAVVMWYMQDPAKVALWRRNTWLIFSFVFFGQFVLGLVGFDIFMMTGKLHLPVPAIILAGPLYRYQLSFMTILFLSTIILSGPAWCSHLCYFGALDNYMASKSKPGRKPIKNKWAVKYSIMLLVITLTLLLRWMHVSWLWAAVLGASFGVIGLFIMLIVSRKQGKMVHCTTYCPIGTVVNYLKYINPFRMYIDDQCDLCMRCTTHCPYDALNVEDIKSKKPALTCTLCGDCVTSCHTGSIKYKFFGMKPAAARNLYLFITISLHAIFMALARM